jgi:hypothetical protein
MVYIVPTNAEYAKLCRHSVSRLGKRSKESFDVVNFQTWSGRKRGSYRSGSYTFFVSRLSDISAETAKKTKSAPGAKFLLFAEGMPFEALAPRLARLDIRDAERLHLAHERGKEVFDVIHRLLRGISQAEGATPIVDAWLEDENLVLLSPSFERLSVPLDRLSKFIGDDPEKVSNFEIDEDGSFLYWEHADVHLGWEQLLQLVDPAAAVAAKAKTAEFNRRYGAAIRALREEAGLKQSDIEGLTDRHLRRIEQGEQAVSRASLQALSAAHGMELGEYMNELARRAKF